MTHRLVANGIGGRTVFDFHCRLNGIDPATLSRTEVALALQDEMYRWMAYDLIYPIGYEDIHFAMLQRLIADVNIAKGKPRPKLKTFMIGELPKKDLTIEDMEKKFYDYFAQTDLLDSD